MSDFIRLAPEPSTTGFTPDEAVDAAKAAFHDARRALADAQSRWGIATSLIFDRRQVTPARLKGMRHATREAIDKALAVEARLTAAIEAFAAVES
jgi:hypothetical protein